MLLWFSPVAFGTRNELDRSVTAQFIFWPAEVRKSIKIQSSRSKLSTLPTVPTVERASSMKKKDTDLWLIRGRASGKVKVTTRCIVVPPSPTQPDTDDENTELNVDSNNNTSPTTTQYDFPDAQQDNSCTSPSTESHYTRNRSTTRSWPVIYRNNSISTTQNYLEPPTQIASKTEQLLTKSEHKRKSSHQYDFDQIFGLNNANYQQYLATVARKASTCEPGYDKSPSLYDMQNLTQEDPSQTRTRNFCSAPPTVIFLLLTLLMTTTATSMLCAAIMTDHWENVIWDKDALTNIVNQSESSKVTNQLEFLLDGKVARLPFKGELKAF